MLILDTQVCGAVCNHTSNFFCNSLYSSAFEMSIFCSYWLLVNDIDAQNFCQLYTCIGVPAMFQ